MEVSTPFFLGSIASVVFQVFLRGNVDFLEALFMGIIAVLVWNFLPKG